MNILYVARDRGSAELAGSALGSIASEVVVSWAGTLGQACRWIDEHRDVAALVVEVGSDIRSFERLVAHTRGAGLSVPLIGVPLTDADDVLLTLAVRADAIVRRDAAFLDRLPEIVSRTLRLMESRPHQPTDSLAREHESPRLQLVSDRDRAACLDLGRLLADAEKGRQALEQRVADAEAARRRAEHQHASALEQVRAHLAAHQQQGDARQAEAINALTGLRAKLVTQAAAVVQVEQQATADRHAAAEHAAQCQAQFDRELAEERTKREALAATLAEVEAEYQKATCHHAAEVAAVREAASDREAAVAHAAAERAAIRQREFEAALQHEKAARDRALAEQNAAFQQSQADRIARLRDECFARQRAEGEYAAVRDQFTKYQQQAETRLAETQRQHSAAITVAEERTSELQKFEVKLAEQKVSFDHALAAQMTEYEEDCRRLVAQHKERLIAVRDELAKAQQHADQLTTYLQQADTRFAEAHRQHAAAIAQAEARQAQSTTVVQELQAKLTDALAALQQHESQAATDRQAAIDQAATRQREFAAALQEEKTARDRALAEQKGAFDQILADRIVQLLDEQAARRQVEAEYAAVRDQFTTHQQQSETQFAEAQRQHAAAIAAAEARFSELQKAAEMRQVQSIAVAKNLEAKLTDAMALLRHQESQAANDRQAAIEQGAIRKREFEAALMVAREEVATAQHARRQLADEAALSEQRRAELETALVQEVATRQRVEEQLLDERGAHQRAEAEQATAMAAARDQFTTYQQHAEARFAEAQREHAVAIAAADVRLTEAQKAVAARLAEQQHQADAQLAAVRERFSRQEQTAKAQQAQSAALAKSLLEKLSQATNDRQAAIEQATTRQREFEAVLHEEKAARDRALAEQKASEQTLADRTVQLLDAHGARRQVESEYASARDRFTTYQQQAEARFAEAQREHVMAIAAADAALQHRDSQAAHDRQAAIEQAATWRREFDAALHEEKAARDRALAEQQAAFDRSSAEAEQRRAELETALAQEGATRQRAEAQLLDERGARQRADAEYATAVQKVVADQRVAADQFAAQRVALQSSVAEEVSPRKAVEAALADNRSERAALQQTVDQVRRAENDNRRRYERTPIGLWRCSRDRSVLQVNQALIALLRYKSAEELLAVDFSTVFESPGELQWIVDRCLASQSTETLETTWRTKQGATIAVRLIGTATSPDVVDLVAIDLTSVRALEERLRKSQRMESVARYATEIAVTCDKLLRRVNYQGQQWLTRVDSDSAHLGAQWLDDVDRASRFLKRLTVYGEEQRKAPELVGIKDVLQDLAPILKRVAGSNVAIVMPKVIASYKLDLDIDRVERILVNVAAYGRQRMPLGGRLMIEVGAVVLDRTFVEKHPNVRPGPYVVLTVAAMKGATPPQWSIVRGAASGIDQPAPQVVTLDVDLGTLEGIVSDCGGHLWIRVEPDGNMELRIHLPRRMLDDRLPARLAGRLRWSKLAGVGT